MYFYTKNDEELYKQQHLINSDHLYFIFLADLRLVNVFESYPLLWAKVVMVRPWRLSGVTFLVIPLILYYLLLSLMGLFDTLCLVLMRLVSLGWRGDLDFLNLTR